MTFRQFHGRVLHVSALDVEPVPTTTASATGSISPAPHTVGRLLRTQKRRPARCRPAQRADAEAAVGSVTAATAVNALATPPTGRPAGESTGAQMAEPIIRSPPPLRPTHGGSLRSVPWQGRPKRTPPVPAVGQQASASSSIWSARRWSGGGTRSMLPRLRGVSRLCCSIQGWVWLSPRGSH